MKKMAVVVVMIMTMTMGLVNQAFGETNKNGLTAEAQIVKEYVEQEATKNPGYTIVSIDMYKFGTLESGSNVYKMDVTWYDHEINAESSGYLFLDDVDIAHAVEEIQKQS